MREVTPDYQACSDEELMLRLKEGEDQTFVELYDRFHLPLYHYFLRVFNNDRMKAEDLLQEFFLKILSRAKTFDPLYKFRNWAFTIAQNMCKNEFRKSHLFDRKNTFSENDGCITQPEMDKQLDLDRFMKVLPQALSQLNFDQRTAFLLHYQAGFKILEISRIQNCSTGTVKSRLFYACKKLSHLLSAFNPTSMGEVKNE